MRFKQIKFQNTHVPKGVRGLVNFGKYDISVIKNTSSYGNKMGLYEIAVFENNRQVELPGITEPGDTVKGYLTEQEVDGIMLKMFAVTGNTGENKLKEVE